MISRVQEYVDAIVDEEIEYLKRKKKLDYDSLRVIHKSLLSFSTKLLEPVMESLRDKDTPELSTLELLGRAIDEHLRRMS
ncbi:MAG: hypothetical protein M1161_03970 [Candidatus Thermoplasmatota archaeon]|nr:hypothetical protein [Candidatus Thermoplasmatota archaeon]